MKALLLLLGAAVATAPVAAFLPVMVSAGILCAKGRQLDVFLRPGDVTGKG